MVTEEALRLNGSCWQLRQNRGASVVRVFEDDWKILFWRKEIERMVHPVEEDERWIRFFRLADGEGTRKSIRDDRVRPLKMG